MAAGSRARRRHGGGQQGARDGMGGDQGDGGALRRTELPQRDGAQPDREDQGRDAIGTDPRVAHDLELAGPVPAAAEAVRHIGEPVLVQGPGEQHGRRDGDQARDQPRKTEHRGEPERAGAGQANPRADQRIGPRGARHVGRLAGREAAQGHPGQKARGGLEVGRPFQQGGGQVIGAHQP
jgi:hypothetical protein